MGFVLGVVYKNEISFKSRSNSHILIKFVLDDNSDMSNMLRHVQGHQVKGQGRSLPITCLAKFDLKDTPSLKLFFSFSTKTFNVFLLAELKTYQMQRKNQFCANSARAKSKKAPVACCTCKSNS